MNVNEDFVTFLTFELITFFIDIVSLGMTSQSITYLLSGIAHNIYWILNLEGEVHSIWDLWTNGLRDCKAIVIFKVGQGTIVIGWVQKISNFFGGLPQPLSTSP